MERTRTRTRLAKVVKQAEEKEVAIRKEETPPSILIPTGSVMLNLACSDRVDGGYGAGRMVNVIGDRSSGKSLLVFSTFAEMARDSRFDDYRFIYDDVEQAMGFDISGLFGSKMAQRLEPPKTDDEGEPLNSDSIQDWFVNIMNAIKDERPFVYVLDSFDALTSDEEGDRVEDLIKAKESGKEMKGSYGMEKAKMAGQILRTIISHLKKTKSLLIIVSQTRDNIDPMSFKKKTRSGGRALEFYATHEIWTAIEKRLKAKERMVGVITVAKVSKNKLTGKERTVGFPIYYSIGVDDLGSCIDFLMDEGHWKQKGNKIVAEELGMEEMRLRLISRIAQEGKEQELYQVTQKVWTDIEKAVKDAVPYSKSKYE